jgi:hypothetical protein
MNRHSDIDRVLQVWMADGPTAIPDRVVDVVAARIGVQRQRRAWPFQGRTNVTTPIKLLAGLAAAVVVAVVGFNLLSGTTGPGAPTTGPSAPTTGPTPSAQPTAAVTAAPSAATFVYPSGILPAGSHATASFLPAFTFTLSEPWVLDGDSVDYYSLFPDTPLNRAEWARTGEAANGILIASKLERPYFVCEAWEDNRGSTAAEMVAAVTATEAIATTGVVDVEIGGLTGKQFDVRLNPDWTETCPGDPPGSDVGDIVGDNRNRVFFLDRPGDIPLVIFAGSMHAADHEAFRAEAMPVLESLEFDLGQ